MLLGLIGDLHIGSLKTRIPNVLQLQQQTIFQHFNYLKQEGVSRVVFLGDVFHTAEPGADSYIGLLRLIRYARSCGLATFFLTGNHDLQSEGSHSLLLLHAIATAWSDCEYPVKVMDKVKNVRVDGGPVRFLPYPHVSFKENYLNLAHQEFKGAKMDNGSRIHSTRSIAPPGKKFTVVSGHLHTPQQCGGALFLGTPYQTSFGEKSKKYIGIAEYDDNWSVTKIKSQPKYKLHTIQVASNPQAQAFLDSVSENIEGKQQDFYRVVCKQGVARQYLEAMQQLGNIVNVNGVPVSSGDSTASDLLQEDTPEELKVMKWLVTYITKKGLTQKATDRAISIIKEIEGEL